MRARLGAGRVAGVARRRFQSQSRADRRDDARFRRALPAAARAERARVSACHRRVRGLTDIDSGSYRISN